MPSTVKPATARVAWATFQPHPLIRGGHAQTILGAYLPHQQRLSATQRQLITLPDGDQLVLHDDCPPSWQPDQRAVLLIHGLGGSHASPYMVRIAAKLFARGVRCWRLDMRGFGAGYALAKHPGHAGRSEDVRATIEAIAQHCPHAPLSAIGFSLGGNIVLKLAAESGDHPPGTLDSIAAVCPPIDLSASSQNIKRGMNFVYDRAFVKALLTMLRRRRSELPHFADEAPLLPRPRNLLEFDDRYTAPKSGFLSAADYYAQSSSGPLLARITLPTLIVAAADDPLIPARIFDPALLSPAIDLQITAGGGHLGFVGVAGVDPDRRWLDWRLLEWAQNQPK
ncbi:MAG TPA: alpha/beta fold hydrolase [Pirellulaceae bacterium]|nr:alpha/beta fold hydrolase [Pirellulaceae bacterium]